MIHIKKTALYARLIDMCFYDELIQLSYLVFSSGAIQNSFK